MIPLDFDYEYYINKYNLSIRTYNFAIKHYLNIGKHLKYKYKHEKLEVIDKLCDVNSFYDLCNYLLPSLSEDFPLIDKNSKKKSLLVENRKLPNLEFTIKNTIQKLGDNWGHIIYCSENNYEEVKEICKFSDNIEIYILDKEIKDQNDYNNLCLDVNFWRKIKSMCDYIFLYQTDGIILKEFKTEYLKYDFLGPTTENYECGKFMNGGMCFRKIDVMIDILENTDISEYNYNKYGLDKEFEDILFSRKIKLKHNKSFGSDHQVKENIFCCHKPYMTKIKESDFNMKIIKEFKTDYKFYINIITRTSNRLKYFKRLIKSVNIQKFNKINHIIINDNNDKYVKRFNPILIKDKPVKLNITDSNGNNHFPYDQYLNNLEIKNRLLDGFVLVLDDDNYLLDKYSLHNLYLFLCSCNNNNLVLTNIKHYCLNLQINSNNVYDIKLGEIDMCQFLLHSSKYYLLNFDEYVGADFRQFSILRDKLDPTFFDFPVVVKDADNCNF
jgi:hypothetical protein